MFILVKFHERRMYMLKEVKERYLFYYIKFIFILLDILKLNLQNFKAEI